MIFKKKKQQENNENLIGKTAKLVHDITVFQSGTIIVNGKSIPVKTADNSMLCKGALVEILREEPPYFIVKLKEIV